MTTSDKPLVLVGRSSSHFTRVTRLFALELGVPYEFRPVFDLTALDPLVFGDNPALKVPVLVDEQGPLFGTENICRALVHRSHVDRRRVVLRGDLLARQVANAEELVLHVMSSGVALITARAAGDGYAAPPKVAASMREALAFIDATLESTLSALPSDRQLSFLEVTLFCVVLHLEFREVMDVSPWPKLREFCARFGERPSARATTYGFDQR